MADPFICSIELSKSDGITVVVTDKKGKITQTVAMNGTTVTITVKKGDEKTSTITQDAESIVFQVEGEQTSTVTQKHDTLSVKCKTFEIDAETVSVKSSRDSTHVAEGKMTLKSTRDMDLSSSAKLSAESTADMKLASSAGLNASATGDAKLAAANVTVDASVNLALKGGMTAALEAAKVNVAGTMKVDVTAPLTTVGQDITTVKGTLVKVEGTLVRLG
jgi:hypothetical protein